MKSAAVARPTIDTLRRRIDRIDDRLLGLLEERAGAARAIGEVKARSGAGVWVPSREKKIVERLIRQRKTLSPAVVRAVFREVISACRSLERGLRIAYLGPEATYSHLAARERFGGGAAFDPVASIPQVFEEVERRRSDFGVVPIENSTDGTVTYTLDRFLESPLSIAAEVRIEVSHSLLSRDGALGKVRRVLSHPQGIAQCRRWLTTHLPHATLHDAPSTAQAAQEASRRPGTAAIASRMAAEVYGLLPIAESIQDLQFNATRFVVVGPEDSPKPSGDDKTSLAFAVRDEVGILHEMLKPFARNRINLTRIESRPLKGKPWEYVFFVDLLGHREDPPVAAALDGLGRRCQMLRVLGSYPVWR